MPTDLVMVPIMVNLILIFSFIFTGALVGERLVHNTTGALWEMNNQGVSRRPHPGPAPADPSLLTTELCISLSLSLSAHCARLSRSCTSTWKAP